MDHGFHRVAEELRGKLGTVDKVISSVKKTFRKAQKQQIVFKFLKMKHLI